MTALSPVSRAMRREDVDAVLLLAHDEPTAPHWPPFEYLRMLKVIAEEPGRRGAWVVEVGSPGGPGVPSSLARPRGIAGFAIASHAAGTCDLEAVVIAPSARRQGLGTLLVDAVIVWARALGAARLQLEVRPSNEAALRLYRGLGFVDDGRRTAYYQNPPEDAVLMSLALSPGTVNL